MNECELKCKADGGGEETDERIQELARGLYSQMVRKNKRK
jgi:hypothetical protein